MIVAIDPSLSCTAVVVGDASHFEVETFASEPRGPMATDRIDRCEDLVSRVMKWVGMWGQPVDAVYLEGYSFGSKGRNEDLAEYGGLLRWHLLDLNRRLFEVPPSTLKKFATGKGTGPKDMIAAHLTKRYGVLLSSNDEYDAYGLYRLGLVAEALVEPDNEAQRSAAATVLAGPGAKRKRKK